MDELIGACKEGRVDDVRQLLEESSLDPSDKDEGGWSPLHYASQYGHPEVVQLLLERNCDPSVETRDRNTALHLACANGCLDVANILMAAASAQSELLRKNRDGNTPLHLACRVGTTEMVKALLERIRATDSDESADTPPCNYYIPNNKNATPFGFAMSSSNFSVANMLLQQTTGNPALSIRDFPTFRSKHSLETPVKVFAIGDREAGKSTLIKSLQVESHWDRFWGVSMNIQGVDKHKMGLVPCEFASREYGRIILYDLASGEDCVHQDLIQSPDDISQSIFMIVVDLREERREMQAKMVHWMNFIHRQCEKYGSLENKPNVAIVGSFADVIKFGRRASPHRMHIAYNKVIASHPELVEKFNLLRKYSLDCRKSASPSLAQLRSALKRMCHRIRPKDSEAEVSSPCYVLSAVLESEFADVPAIQLGNLVSRVIEKASRSSSQKTLCTLLPQTTESLLSLCEILQDRNRLVLFRPPSSSHSIDYTWIVHRRHQLISMIDKALSAPKRASKADLAHLNPAAFTRQYLEVCLSSIPLDINLLIRVMEHFQIHHSPESPDPAESPVNDPVSFYIPSLLSKDDNVRSWNVKENGYSFGFAWSFVPAPGQFCPYFMPHFVKLLLLSLFNLLKGAEFESCIVWSNGIHCNTQNEMEVCVMVGSKAITVNMRCKNDHEVACLLLRNDILDEIKSQKEKLQPDMKVEEIIIPLDLSIAHFPLKSPESAGLYFNVAELKSNILKSSPTGGSVAEIELLLFLEPYIILSSMSEEHRGLLTNPEHTSQAASEEFITALAKCFGDKWKCMIEHFAFELPQLESDADISEGSSSDTSAEEPVVQYGQLLEHFGSISIFGPTGLKKAFQERKTEGTHLLDLPPTAYEGDVHLYTQRVDTPTTQHTGFGTSDSDLSDGGNNRWKLNGSGSISSSEAAYPPPTAMMQPVQSRRLIGGHIHFVTPVEEIRCDSTGGMYTSTAHDITIIIPEGAVDEEDSPVRLEIGVALQGPFTFPTNTKPVSPIVWLHTNQEGTPFNKSIEVTLPHCINYSEESSNGCNLTFFMGEKKQGETFRFEKVRKSGSGIQAEYGTIRTRLSKHPCFVCIATTSKSNLEVFSRTNYCISKVVPLSSHKHFKVHFYVTYDLPTCTEVVRKSAAIQFSPGEEYDITTKEFSFESASKTTEPFIEIHFRKMLQQSQWYLGLDLGTKQIHANQIDFWSATRRKKRTYPPQFTVTVRGDGAIAGDNAEVKFTGIDQKLVDDIPLQVPPTFSRTSSVRSLRSVGGMSDISVDLPVSPRNTLSPEQVMISGNILDKHILKMIRFLNMDMIRAPLREVHALTDDEHDALLNLAASHEIPKRVAVEKLLGMLRSKGSIGLLRFVAALRKTTEGTGHHDIVEAIEGDPEFPEIQRRSSFIGPP